MSFVRCLSPSYVEEPRTKLSYRERYERDQTYATQQGGRHFKERLPAPAPVSTAPTQPQQQTDAEYESDFDVDREPLKLEEEEFESHEYDNDSFIIDDDSKDEDLTASSHEVSATDKSSKRTKDKVS